MDIPVFVINLKSSLERKSHTINQLGQLGITYQFIEAIDRDHPSVGKVVKNQKHIFTYRSMARYLKKEEIGCALSHIKLYNKMIDEDISIACILEDDNNFNADFKEFLNINNLNIIDWDILHLGSFFHNSKKGAHCKGKKKLPINGYKIGVPIEVPLGTHAYIIKKNTAKKLLNNIYPLRMPIDHFTGNAGALHLKSYVVSPPCTLQNLTLDSTIPHNAEHTFLKPPFGVKRSLVQKIYRCFPWLKLFWKWLLYVKHYPLLILRKIGLIKNNYAKIK